MIMMNGRPPPPSPPSAQAAKRRLDAASQTDLLPAKKARLTPPHHQVVSDGAYGDDGHNGNGNSHVRSTDDTADDYAAVLAPAPKYPGASFLGSFVDPSSGINPQSFVSDWLASVGSDRRSLCSRSDGYIRRAQTPVARRARSEPDMGHSRDADGFLVPLTPASSRSTPAGDQPWTASYAGSVAPSDASLGSGSARSPGRSLVEDPLYRDTNLAANGIYLRHPCDPMPDDVAALVDQVGRERDSPGPSAEDVGRDRALYDLSISAAEPDVEQYFYAHVFPSPGLSDELKRTDRQPMARHAVPSAGARLKVSTPVPDALYGYNRSAALQQPQQQQLISMGTDMVANNQGLIYPFFVIEFKGDGPSGAGSLWVATNQCLGGSASCVNIAERLNRQLRQCRSGGDVRPVATAAFSIAMSGTEARLYVSWQRGELEYYMQQVQCFVLQRPEHYIEFRRYVRNIIDWGKDRRLREIRDSLDILLEESRKRAAAEAKARPPPSSESSSSSGSGSGSSRSKKKKS